MVAGDCEADFGVGGIAATFVEEVDVWGVLGIVLRNHYFSVVNAVLVLRVRESDDGEVPDVLFVCRLDVEALGGLGIVGDFLLQSLFLD